MHKSLLLLTLLTGLLALSNGESCDVGPCSFDMINYMHKYLERSDAVRNQRARERAAAARKAVEAGERGKKFAFASTEDDDVFAEARDKFARDQEMKFAQGDRKFAFAAKDHSLPDLRSDFDVDM